MVQAVEVALNTIGNQIDLLPEPSDPDFTQRVGMVLDRPAQAGTGGLQRRADHEGGRGGGPGAQRGAAPVPRRDDAGREVAEATLGQQVFAARQRAELSVEEAANAAGVSVDTLTAVEADGAVNGDAVAAVRGLLSSLTRV